MKKYSLLKDLIDNETLAILALVVLALADFTQISTAMYGILGIAGIKKVIDSNKGGG